MTKSRLEAFSDGVIAIIMTVMVLELKVPHGTDLAALAAVSPQFLTYLLSFVFIAIYWNNHHHLLHATERVNGVILWANMHLLFWLSLVPFVTAWMGENGSVPLPTAIYGVVLLMAAIAFTILVNAILALQGKNSVLGRAVGRDYKGKVSLVIYIAAIPLAFVHQTVAHVLFVVVALIWLAPDPRIESQISK